MAAEGRLELRDVRHHEAKLGGLVGEFALQIEEIRAGNMTGLEGVASGHDDIGNVAAVRLIVEIGGAIEDAQVGLADAGQRVPAVEISPLRSAMFRSPDHDCLRCYGVRR